MTERDFYAVVNGQLPTQEELVANALGGFKALLKNGPQTGNGFEAEYVERYLEVLGACGFDESKAQSLIEGCLDGEAPDGRA